MCPSIRGIGFAEAPKQAFELRNEKMELGKSLFHFPCMSLFSPSSSSDTLLPTKKGRENFGFIFVF
jgi:hypothetical protein